MATMPSLSALALVYAPKRQAARAYYDKLSELRMMLDDDGLRYWPDRSMARCVIEAAERAKAYLADVEKHGEPSVVVLEGTDG